MASTSRNAHSSTKLLLIGADLLYTTLSSEKESMSIVFRLKWCVTLRRVTFVPEIWKNHFPKVIHSVSPLPCDTLNLSGFSNMYTNFLSHISFIQNESSSVHFTVISKTFDYIFPFGVYWSSAYNSGIKFKTTKSCNNYASLLVLNLNPKYLY
jgi:hypothetical protein